MIILSSNSKEQLMKVETECLAESWSSSMRGSVSLDFGKHIIYSDYNTLINENVFYNVTDEFGADDIIDDLSDLSDLSTVVYVYKLDETDASVRHIPLDELLSSNNDDEFTTGCFLAARMLYIDEEENYLLDKDIVLADGTTICNINKDSLRKIILDKDKTGRSSFIGKILIDYSEELLYKNSLRLDQTGEFAYSYIKQDCALNEVAEAKIIEKDTDGFFTIELLNYTDASPMPLAEKIVSIKNPFKIVDFINRYEKYLEKFKADERIDTEFVRAENEIRYYLNTALIELDYSNINMKKIIEENKYDYETNLDVALSKILYLLINDGRSNKAESLLDAIRKYFNDDFIYETKNSTDRDIVKRVKHYKLRPDTIYTVLTTSNNLHVSKQTMSEFLEISEKSLLVSLNKAVHTKK